MFRVKLRGHPPIHQPRITHRHNSISSSIIRQARITAGAVAVKVKRAIDQGVTLTVTSTRAGASKVLQDLWVSQVQAKSVVWLPSRREAMYGIVDHLAHLGILHPGGFLPSFTYISSSSTYPTWPAGVPILLLLQTWVALDIGVLTARWRDSYWHNPQNAGGRSGVLFVWMHECEIGTFRNYVA